MAQTIRDAKKGATAAPTAAIDWDKWSKMDCLTLTQGLKLLVGEDPDTISPAPADAGHAANAPWYEHLPNGRTLFELLEASVLTGNLTLLGGLTQPPHGFWSMAKVETKELVRWAMSKGIEVPKRLRGLDPRPSEGPIDRRRLASMSKILLGLAAKYGYRPDDSRSDSTSKIVNAVQANGGFELSDETVRRCLDEALARLDDTERDAFKQVTEKDGV